jgi:ferredoxin
MMVSSVLLLLMMGLVMSQGSAQPMTPSLTSVAATKATPAAQRTAAAPVHFLRMAPSIKAGVPAPHGSRGQCRSCHRIITDPRMSRPAALPAAGPLPAAQAGPIPDLNMLPFQEAHWQGLEMITLTTGMARILKIPSSSKGVVIDEATMPADMNGFLAGDLITAVDHLPTPDLESFVQAAEKFRHRKQIQIHMLRKGKPVSLTLTALTGRLGNANGETAPMIRAGSRPPHGYLGPCTNCHHIGANRNLAVDVGDTLAKSAPAIRASQPSPHRNRGKCSSCHTIR